MSLPQTVPELIDLWPSKAALARKLPKLKADGGSSCWHWHKAKAIPEKHWMDIVTAAEACGFTGITYQLILSLHRT